MAASLWTTVLDVGEVVAELGVNWMIQSTLLLAAGLSCGWYLRRRGSAAQSAVYRTTLAAVFVCPLATWGLGELGFSGWSVRFSPGWMYALSEPGRQSMLAATVKVPPLSPTALLDRPELSLPATAIPRGDAPQPAIVRTEETPIDMPAGPAAALPEPAPSASVEPSSAVPSLSVHRVGILALALLVTWAVVSTLLLARLAWAWRRIGQLRQRAHRADADTLRVCRRLAEELRVRSPDVLHSPFLPSPCLTGILRPAVMLPEAELKLSRRDVLIHELAHLRRRDCHWNLFRQLATAACFFQPLMWILSRRLEFTAEEVCDDFVVQYGGDRADYAHRLVDIAELGSLRMAAAGVGIVSLRSMLARRVTRIMDTSRSLSTRVGNLLLAIVVLAGIGSAMLAGFVGLGEQMVAESPARDAETDDDAKDSDAHVELHGLVVDENGRPLPGVTVYSLRQRLEGQSRRAVEQEELARSESDAQGRFTIEAPADDFNYPRKHEEFETDRWSGATIVAAAPNHAVAWVRANNGGADREIRLVIPPDDAAVRGRLLDLQGQPMAGVSVTLKGLYATEGRSVDEWLGDLRQLHAKGLLPLKANDVIYVHEDNEELQKARFPSDGEPLEKTWPELPATVVTDADGRFEIRGLGRDRLANLELSGAGIFKQIISCVTREMEPIEARQASFHWIPTHRHYGQTFDHVVAPGQTIVGIVSDEETGEPVEGVEVTSSVGAGAPWSIDGWHTTTTDASGRFRLDGMPVGAGNELKVIPGAGQPYLMASGVQVPTSAELKPAKVAIKLRRGVLVRGRVMDSETGEPVMATLHHHPYLTNKFAKNYSRYKTEVSYADFNGERYRTAADGSFEIVVIPGRGILAARVLDKADYSLGAGAEKIAGRDKGDRYPTHDFCSPRMYHILAEVDLSADATEWSQDLTAVRGKTAVLDLIDADGGALSGVRVGNSAPGKEYIIAPAKTSRIEITGLRADEVRQVALWHEERKVGRIITVRPSAEPTVVTLQPCATITGRLVDDEQQPVANVMVEANLLPGGDHSLRLEPWRSDEDGVFKGESLLAGGSFGIYASGERFGFQDLVEEVEAAPGETVDLGTIDLASDERPAPKRSAAAGEPDVDDDVITVRGRVVDPQGTPLGGADVYALRWYWNFGKPAPLAQVKTNDAGEFEISYRKSQFNEPGGRPEQWREVYIAAAAESFGPGWIGYEDIEAGREPVVRLAVDDVPIEGRVVDLEGRPVSGARIEVGEIMAGKNGDLSPWIEAIGAGQSLSAAASQLDDSLPLFAAGRWPSVVTDADGRFRMTGVGRDRAVRLHVKHPALVISSIQVVTREMEPISHPAFDFPGSHDNTVYGARFEFAAAPSRTIQGTVRDAETGEPIAGVGVWSNQFAGQNISGFHSIKVKSDEQGRYQLEGMPKGEGNRLVVVPADLPYFTSTKDVPDPAEMEPVELDIDLHRGVWVTGRVTDKATGRGVPSALMHYVPFPDNERAAELPEFQDNSHIMTVQDRYGTQSDGSYRVVALPGRGIVGVKSVREAYPSAQGYKEIEELKDREGFMKYGSAFAPTEKFPTAVKEVNVDVDDAEVVCDFELDPGRRVKLRAVDESEAPLAGVEVAGARGIGDHYKKFSTPDIEVAAMRDDERRTVLAVHRKRRLGKALHIDASQAGETPIAIRLEPCATVKGRLVDGNGAPINGASLRVDVYRDGDYGQSLDGTATDAEGRFSHDGLLPGLPYSVYAESRQYQFSVIAKKLEVAPGETIDLGDVDVTSEQRTKPKRMAPATASTAPTDDSAPAKLLEYAGSVVTPEGKPAVGARLYLPDNALRLVESTNAEPRAVTDAEGKFRFMIDPAQQAGGGGDWDPGTIIAVADGYGMAWAPAALYETSGTMLSKARARLANAPTAWRELLGDVFQASGQPLRLVADDEPIRGRVVDINGQPVAGARLTLREVCAAAGEDLAPWVEATKAPQADFYSARMKTPLSILGPTVAALAPPAVTDADGRFTMRGVGRQRIAQLMIAGPNLQMERFYARTQAGETIEIPQEFRSPYLGKATYYAVDLTYVAGPSKPIIGAVRDRETKQPLAGVLIMSQKRHGHAIHGWGEDFVRTTSDAGGRYRLEGMPIGEDNEIGAVPQGEEPYMPMGVAASTDGPASEFEVNFDLPKGVWIAGRVTDGESGQGVAGEVSYFMFPDNEFLKDSRGVGNVDLRGVYATNGDGRFQISAIPGRGIVAFRAHEGQRYSRGVGAEEITGAKADIGARYFTTLPSYCMTSDYQIVKEINPAVDAGQVTLDLTLDPQQSIRGRIVDPDGKPLSGVHIVGNSPSYGWRRSNGDAFEVLGYEPAKGRLLGFYHQEQNLVGRVDLSGEPPKDLLVTLQPGGKVTGRVVDESGTPQAEVWLTRWKPRVRTMADMHARESTMQLPPNRDHKQSGEYFTNAEGKFEISGLMPGEVYRLSAIDRGTNTSIGPRALGVLEKAIVVELGQTRELGDVQIIDREEFEKRADRAGNAAGNAPAGEDLQTTSSTTANSDKTAEAAMASIRGSVTGVDGQTASDINVAVVARIQLPSRGGEFLPQAQVLGEATTDAAGQFELTASSDPGRANAPAFVVARADNAALAWKRFNLGAAPADIALSLEPQTPLRGQLVDVDGQPAASVTINYEAVFVAPAAGEYAEPDGVGFDDPAHRPAAWPPAIVTDAEGRFTLHHLAAGHAVKLKVQGNDRIAPQDIILNSGMPEQRGQRDATYRSLMKNLKPGEEAVLTVAPAQVFEGTVRYADTGEPAAHARLTIWASQQAEGGSMISVAGKADAEGRYRITPLPGVRFGVTAYPPDGVPYFPQQSDEVKWNDADRTKTVDIALKRGVLVRGQIKEAESGEPIAGASIQYGPKSSNPNNAEKLIFGWQGIQTSDERGRFEIVVLPGAGTLLAHGPRNEYLLLESTYRQMHEGKPGGSRQYAHFIQAIEPTPEQSPLELTIELRRGGTVRGTLVDEEGASVDQAKLISWRNISALDLRWRGHSPDVVGGRFEMNGLAPDTEYPVYFLSAERGLGASTTIRAEEPAPNVVMRPLGKATMRFVDQKGVPLAKFPAQVEFVARPGGYRFDIKAMRAGAVAADADFIANIDRYHYPKAASTEADAEGRLSLPALIPGATYWIFTNVEGGPSVAKEFVAKTGNTINLGDIRVKPIEE